MRRYVLPPARRSSWSLRMAVGRRMGSTEYFTDLCWVEQRPKTGKKNTINYHLMRLYPKIRGPTKQGK